MLNPYILTEILILLQKGNNKRYGRKKIHSHLCLERELCRLTKVPPNMMTAISGAVSMLQGSRMGRNVAPAVITR